MRKLLLVLALLSPALLGAPDSASAHSGDSIDSGFGTPTIDGVIEPGEWTASEVVPVFSGAYAGSFLYVVNDADNLYIYVRVAGDDDLGSDDWVDLRFDNAHNGTSTANDDELQLNGTGIFADDHYDGTSWGTPDATNGGGAAARSASNNIFELSHPLNSGEASDIASAPGDTLGFCLTAFVDAMSASSLTFPAACNLTANAQGLYAHIVLADFAAGDADCSGAVESIDALFVLQLDAGFLTKLPCLAAADANDDGDVNSLDALIILQTVAGLL